VSWGDHAKSAIQRVHEGLPQDVSLADRIKWTDTRIAILREHVALGLSAGQSGALLGVSRNTCMGKANRLGMKFGGGKAADPERGFRRGRPKSTAPRATAKPRVVPVPTPEPAPIINGFPDMDFVRPIGVNPKTLMDCCAYECRWPLGPTSQPGTMDTLFCCAPVAHNKHGDATSFCPTHLARSRAPSQPKAQNAWNPDSVPSRRRAA
jgi:hypothetical protein